MSTELDQARLELYYMHRERIDLNKGILRPYINRTGYFKGYCIVCKEVLSTKSDIRATYHRDDKKCLKKAIKHLFT